LPGSASAGATSSALAASREQPLAGEGEPIRVHTRELQSAAQCMRVQAAAAWERQSTARALHRGAAHPRLHCLSIASFSHLRSDFARLEASGECAACGDSARRVATACAGAASQRRTRERKAAAGAVRRLLLCITGVIAAGTGSLFNARKTCVSPGPPAAEQHQHRRRRRSKFLRRRIAPVPTC
jgi:hypothetical protein